LVKRHLTTALLLFLCLFILWGLIRFIAMIQKLTNLQLRAFRHICLSQYRLFMV
jgi:hypothetical protein